MSWLAAATKAAGVPKVSIIQRLKSSMAAFEDARDYKVVHASDVTKPDFCPRRWAYYDITGTGPKGSWVGTALRATYDLGNSTASVLIEKWAGEYAIGNWQCSTCDSQRSMCAKPKTGCTNLGKGTCNWQYKEVNFISQEYGISGSIDVLFDLGAMNLCVTELKIYAADEFDKMVAPLPEHRTRTQLYLKIIADSDSPYKNKINLHQARVFYTSRGFGKMNKDHGEVLPFREFVVDRNDESPDVQHALWKAKQVKIYRETKAMPSGICTTPTDKVAKACGFCQQCFSGENPAQQESWSA